MANTHEHLEHAEHDSHFALRPFDQKVAVTMAIVAACLAGVSMLGHRTHNRVLKLQTVAASFRVEASNNWAWYQAKRLRQAQYESYPELVAVLNPAALVRKDAEEPRGDEKQRKTPVERWAGKVEEYKGELKEIEEKAKAAEAKVREAEAEAEHAHHQANRLDVSHVSCEMGLVLCSIALLTKRRGWWYAGIVCAALALGITASAYLIPQDDQPPTAAPEARR